MAFELFTSERATRKPTDSKPHGTFNNKGDLYLTLGAVRSMGLAKGARAEVLIDPDATRLALRFGGPEMNGSSRAVTVMKNGAFLSVASALKGFKMEAPAASIRSVPQYENGLWVFDLPPSMKAKA